MRENGINEEIYEEKRKISMGDKNRKKSNGGDKREETIDKGRE